MDLVVKSHSQERDPRRCGPRVESHVVSVALLLCVLSLFSNQPPAAARLSARPDLNSLWSGNDDCPQGLRVRRSTLLPSTATTRSIGLGNDVRPISIRAPDRLVVWLLGPSWLESWRGRDCNQTTDAKPCETECEPELPPLHPPSAVTDGTAHTRSLAPSPCCPFPSPLPRCFHAEDHENRRGAAVTQPRATGPGTKPIQLRTAPPNASPTAAAASSSSLSFIKLHPSVVGRSSWSPRFYRLLLRTALSNPKYPLPSSTARRRTDE